MGFNYDDLVEEGEDFLLPFLLLLLELLPVDRAPPAYLLLQLLDYGCECLEVELGIGYFLVFLLERSLYLLPLLDANHAEVLLLNCAGEELEPSARDYLQLLEQRHVESNTESIEVIVLHVFL